MPCGGCAGAAEYYRRTRKVVLVQKSTIGALGSLGWYSRILKDPYGGCAGTAEYYRSNGEAVLVQQNNIGALGRQCWYRRVL